MSWPRRAKLMVIRSAFWRRAYASSASAARPSSASARAARAKAIYAEDASYEIRKAHENPAVIRLYEEFLTDGPCGEKSHHLLHTHYTPRGKYIA